MKRTRKNRHVANLAEWKGLHRQGKPPKVLVDQELREYLDEALTRMTFKEAAEATREHFGPKRGISTSSAHRYWQAKQRKPGK